jgi:tRNA modification GTPase
VSLVVRELTATAPGGVAVLSVAGAGALARVRALVPDPGRLVPPRLVLTELRGGGGAGELLDQALVFVEGEEACELHLHGCPPLVRRLIAELGGEPTELARPRTIEEEARERMLAAPSQACARMLLDQSEGALRRELEELLSIPADGVALRLEHLLERARRALVLERPPRVVLAGPANAGKSTLFNLLLGEERALVYSLAGTTRDALRGQAHLGDWAVELIDTAGERRLGGEKGGAAAVERAGQDIGRHLRAGADWICWLDPDPEAAPACEGADGGVVWTLFTSRSDEKPPELLAGCARPLSALSDPQAACALFQRSFLEVFSLPARAWTEGQGVPFTATLRRALGRAHAAWSKGAEAAGREILTGLISA